MSYPWFHQVAERLTDPLVLMTARSEVVACNRAAKKAFGANLTGTVLCDRADTPEKFRDFVRSALRSSAPLPGSAQFSGNPSRWRCDGSAVFDGEARLAVVHMRLFSESVRRFTALNDQIAKLQAEVRKRELLEAERELLLEQERSARAAAEESSRFKDDLLASVSHELRTPLHAIKGWVTLLKDTRPDRARFEHGLGVIERNVQVQSELVEDLVDVSMGVTGRMTLEVQAVDLGAVVRQAVETATPAVQAKGQRLEVIANVGSCVVHGDPSRLLQVVWNLLSNATKYTPKGGKIQVVLRQVNSHVEILVSDTGAGISRELLPYVFDRFRRAESGSTRRSGGLGLGLAIVRHLVELHGGVVMAESEGENKGSTFIVNLPLPVFHSKSAVRHDAVRSDESNALKGVRILLVEDHDDSRELLEHVLAGEGARVFGAASAKAAYESFYNEEIDLIISDIEMPEEDGFTLMKKLRELERALVKTSVPAIAISAHSIGDARLHALRAGFQSFVGKPVNPPELVALIQSLYEHQDRVSQPPSQPPSA